MNMLDDVEFQIARLALGPGDILAVRTAQPISAIAAAELTARIGRTFDLAGRVMVIDSTVELSVLAQPGLEPDPLSAAAAAVKPEHVAPPPSGAVPQSSRQRR